MKTLLTQYLPWAVLVLAIGAGIFCWGAHYYVLAGICLAISILALVLIYELHQNPPYQ